MNTLTSPAIKRRKRKKTATGSVQSVERLTAEREDAVSIPGAGPMLRVLK